MKRGVLVALAVLAIGAYLFWPTDERRVRRRLEALAEAVNERPTDGIGIVAHAAQLALYFTPDVVLDPGHRAGPIRGRERLIALASRAPAGGAAFEVDFVDVSVTVDGDTASSRLTATLTTRANAAEPAAVDAREVEVQWRREDEWRIARITLVDPLERPEVP